MRLSGSLQLLRYAAAGAVLALSACAGLNLGGGAAKTSPPPEAASAPDSGSAPADVAAGQRDLSEGIALYEEGSYEAAISKLSGSNDLAAAPPRMQATAAKYLAFSYCVTKRPVLCRQEFDKAYALDANFDLAPSEKGHPLWGPIFERAKSSAGPKK